MNRRNFLGLVSAAAAGAMTERLWPFRAYSFPSDLGRRAKQIVIPELASYGIVRGDLVLSSNILELMDIYSADTSLYRGTFIYDRDLKVYRSWSLATDLTPAELKRIWPQPPDGNGFLNLVRS